MLQVRGLRPADAQKKNTSKDCDRRDNNNNNNNGNFCCVFECTIIVILCYV